MTKPIRRDNGQFNGSVGEGGKHAPVTAPVTVTSPMSPGEDGPAPLLLPGTLTGTREMRGWRRDPRTGAYLNYATDTNEYEAALDILDGDGTGVEAVFDAMGITHSVDEVNTHLTPEEAAIVPCMPMDRPVATWAPNDLREDIDVVEHSDGTATVQSYGDSYRDSGVLGRYASTDEALAALRDFRDYEDLNVREDAFEEARQRISYFSHQSTNYEMAMEVNQFGDHQWTVTDGERHFVLRNTPHGMVYCITNGGEEEFVDGFELSCGHDPVLDSFRIAQFLNGDA